MISVNCVNTHRWRFLASGEGHAQAVDSGPGLSRETRISEAAYELYERRGREHGHDLDDSLAAKAAMGG